MNEITSYLLIYWLNYSGLTLRKAVEFAEEGAQRPVMRQISDQMHPCTQWRHHDATEG